MYLCSSKFVAMTVLTIKINQRTKAGKAFMAMSESFFKGVNGIEVIEEHPKKEKKTSSPYDPKFVKMVLDSAKNKNSIAIDPNNVWESLGLK